MSEESIVNLTIGLTLNSAVFYVLFLVKMYRNRAKVFGFWHFMPYFSEFIVWCFCIYLIYFKEINEIEKINFHNQLYSSTMNLVIIYFADKFLRFIHRKENE